MPNVLGKKVSKGFSDVPMLLLDSGDILDKKLQNASNDSNVFTFIFIPHITFKLA